MTEFDGKTVVITGAAGGIGQAMARLFAEQGASIGALDQSEAVGDFAETLAGEGITAATAIADIADQDAVDTAIRKIRGKLGSIDVLVNNAGLAGPNNLESTDGDTWRRDVATNLNGAFYCTSAVIDDMKDRGGAIVNIGSVNGFMSLGNPAYSAAKAGLISYTKALAMEYGRFGIRANMVSPGTVRTPIWDERVKKNPGIFEDLVKWYPLRRVALPEDIARAVAFLASPLSSAITGAILPVDCGLLAGNIVMSREITMQEF